MAWHALTLTPTHCHANITPTPAVLCTIVIVHKEAHYILPFGFFAVSDEMRILSCSLLVFDHTHPSLHAVYTSAMLLCLCQVLLNRDSHDNYVVQW